MYNQMDIDRNLLPSKNKSVGKEIKLLSVIT